MGISGSWMLFTGLIGLMMAAYFSAIMSNADSCLMASSGNTMADVINKFLQWDNRSPQYMNLSRIVTSILGALALLLALYSENVLELMLESYAVMVSGLFVPILGALYWKRSTSLGALAGMIGGGLSTLTISTLNYAPLLGLDPVIYGMVFSLLLFVVFSLLNSEN